MIEKKLRRKNGEKIKCDNLLHGRNLVYISHCITVFHSWLVSNGCGERGGGGLNKPAGHAFLDSGEKCTSFVI